MKPMDTTSLPTITLDMHQRTATDSPRTSRSYVLADYGYGIPDLTTLASLKADEFWPQLVAKGWGRLIANVEVELPEIMWGTSHEIRASIRDAAIAEAEKLDLVPSY